MIPVTEPFLPPKEEYKNLISGIWTRNWLTNNGPLVKNLELNLKNYLGLEHLLYVSNGTMALQLAIKALDLKGEIITTPFSYVATTSSIVWEGCKPIFVDIDRKTLNIDPYKIEEKISGATTAILATHVYGNSCDIDAIDAIANKHNLSIIYDAAHCFGSKYKGKSVFNYGDISVSSFHATKLFHTIEGGAVFSSKAGLIKKMSFMRNFGHSSPTDFEGVGINGKNSEFHAAMGLINLNYVNSILDKRKELSEYYDSVLTNLDITKPEINKHTDFNYAYYPIVFRTEKILLKNLDKMNRAEIYPRRYFYPLLSALPYVEKSQMPNAESISSRVLCLPLFHALSKTKIDMIAKLLLRIQKHS